MAEIRGQARYIVVIASAIHRTNVKCDIVELVLNIKYDNIGYSLIFQAIAWGFPVTAAFWQPAYRIFHKILGNNNIPVAIFRRNWWEYITLAILVPIPIAMLFRGLQMVFK